MATKAVFAAESLNQKLLEEYRRRFAAVGAFTEQVADAVDMAERAGKPGSL